MEKFKVTGMTCAACSARVERAARGVPGVTSCSVNLLTGDMTTEGDAKTEDVLRAVEKAGYGITSADKKAVKAPVDNDQGAETAKLTARLISSVIFLLLLMYVSMGHMMLSLPLPSFLTESHTAMGLMQLLLSGAVMVINQRFFISGTKALIRLSPNMDTLVSLGSAASFIYSTVILFLTAVEEAAGNTSAAAEYMHQFYFESAAMILTLITVGKLLESIAKGRTTNALRALMDLTPPTATLIINGEEKEIPAEDVKVGDVFVVKAGGKFPVDGVIIDGECAADESSLTGESIPVHKAAGDSVSAGCINTSGYVKCRSLKVGEDTALAGIIKTVRDAAGTKAPIASLADKVSGIFVPVVIGIALVTGIIWFAVSKDMGFVLQRAVSVLVISCPCALGLATPVAIMVGSGVGAKNGILFKTAASLEEMGKVKVIALDKTGTITEGKPKVTDIIPMHGISIAELATVAASLEAKSDHPIAKAITAYADEAHVTVINADDFTVHAGFGLSAKLDGVPVYAGKRDHIEKYVNLSEDILRRADELSGSGKTPIFVARDNTLLGIIAVADTVKPDSAEAIGEMKKLGLHVVMITGDNRSTAEAIGKTAGIDAITANVLPGEKAKAIEDLKSIGKVAMVGDGINDAPALVTADVGVAIGAGVDVALDSADVVLTGSSLTDAVNAYKLSRRTLVTVKENLFWAFIYNVIGIPLAAGAFIPMLGWELSPMFGAAAMSLSSFFVVSNALRLNRIKLHTHKFSTDTSKNEQVNIIKENITMTKTVKIEGMMCPHCEAHVKKALEALEGVTNATTSHTDACAVIESTVEIPDDVIKAAVEGAGYKYIG
ncbi:MAG: heavy metal translocating P-type ATPase [Clostridia bacterium]|nr:heavy metal translocating P-type ATPase [Clostridia bacterium]